MPKPYSEDLRRKVIEVYESKNMKIKEICKVFNITRKTLFLWRKRKQKTGNIKPILNYQKGHSHKIKDLDELKNYLAENKDVTVQKVIEKFGDMTKETVYNYFKKLNYTYKKTFLYEQRDKNKQEDFLKEIAKIMNEDLVYIDESGIDDNEFYKYGWSEKGKRLFDNKPAYKIKRMSIIGALNKGKLKALWAFEGHCNSKIFESYVKNILIPVLKCGQIIVLDNATFHKSKATKQLIENAGCKLLFLPPYSPNLNPIEHFWFAIKHNIRKILPNYWPNIKNAIDFVFQDMSKHYFS